jgi:hypothetical protein
VPFELDNLGAGAGLFSIRDLLVDHARILVFGAFLISFGWIVYLRRGGSLGTAVVLAVASLLVVTAANLRTLETPLLKMVRANR